MSSIGASGKPVHTEVNTHWELSTCRTRELDQEYILPTYQRFDVVLSKGVGAWVWDEAGRSYLDFGGGIAVCSLGHAHPRVTKAVAEQAARLVHTSNLFFTRPQAELAYRLVELVGTPGKVFFCNSGAEANEGLIKLARMFGSSDGRYEVLTFERSFHGRTLAGISATGQEKVKKGFAPLLEGFHHLPLNDLGAVEAAIRPETAAILLEPIQGEGGIYLADPEFLQGLRSLCDRHQLLLLFDEIQCGLGRTGDWCAWKSLVGNSVVPDAVAWAKGIANGFPLGAFWVRDREVVNRGPLCDLLGPGTHGTTYGGNPVCCAAALAVLDTMVQENLLQNVLEAGAFLREELYALASPFIKDVRAIGLMIGIELVGDYRERCGHTHAGTTARVVAEQLLEAGLLVVPAGETTIRLLPPLNVTRDELIQGIDRIARVLRART